jgi:high-affinity K+ transport system ATPase subunit B
MKTSFFVKQDGINSKMCQMSVSTMAMNSKFAKQHCQMCAQVCESCAKDCEMFKILIAKSVLKCAVAVQMNVEKCLTGDNKIVANYVGKNLGITNVIAEILSSPKADEIERLQKKGYVVAMTGDGVNDAPSLAKADLGIAIGAGTDVAIETADVILVKNNHQDVVSLIKLSKARYRKMIQNPI